VFSSKAVLHPSWQEKSGFSNLHQMTSAPAALIHLMILQGQVLRGSTGGAHWWEDRSGQAGVKADAESDIVLIPLIPWRPETTSPDVAQHNTSINTLMRLIGGLCEKW